MPLALAAVLEGSADPVEEVLVAGAAVERVAPAGVAVPGNAEIVISSPDSSATGDNPAGSMAWCFSI
jgi:hypothetical protein